MFTQIGSERRKKEKKRGKKRQYDTDTKVTNFIEKNQMDAMIDKFAKKTFFVTNFCPWMYSCTSLDFPLGFLVPLKVYISPYQPLLKQYFSLTSMKLCYSTAIIFVFLLIDFLPHFQTP